MSAEVFLMSPHGSTPLTTWRTRAISAYQGSQPQMVAALAQHLLVAVRQITGHTIEAEAIIVDAQQQSALATLDGVRFRWSRAGLLLIRPCVHCGCGSFESQSLQNEQELGYALDGWQPRHHDCQPFEADDVYP